ncbi:MAG TPA: tRNA 2-thiouridine(34) synthase MnmA [Polyangia bacterium]
MSSPGLSSPASTADAIAALPRLATRKSRIVVAMSGGVDSSTAAALLWERGHDVVGVTLKLYDARGTAASIGGRCCTPRDIEDARATATRFGFPHYVLDESEAFAKGVIEDFVTSHRLARTPNPCVRCNEKMKFGPLVRFARSVGADALATGHYARVETGPEGLRLLRAVDREKDQAYFLFAVDPSLFDHVQFPLGDMNKGAVRAEAQRLGLPNWNKPDSHEICFVPGGDHKAFVEARGGAGKAGDIVDEGGRVLGEHKGTHNFTIGQRKGLPGVGGADPRFVLRIDAATGKVFVGPRSNLGRRDVVVNDTRWLRDPSSEPFACAVQIRHHSVAHPATVVRTSEGAQVTFDQPVEGVAPGQAAVFFRDDEVLGGGWIDA